MCVYIYISNVRIYEVKKSRLKREEKRKKEKEGVTKVGYIIFKKKKRKQKFN